MDNKKVYIGIDVGKDWLDFAVAGNNKITRFGNHDQGIGKIVEQIDLLNPRLVAVEASGGYESAFVNTLRGTKQSFFFLKSFFAFFVVFVVNLLSIQIRATHSAACG